MIEACPICDTLWRLYGKATDNLHELVGKHREGRDKGDQNTADILSHEIAIAESTLRAVRCELQRHEDARHGKRQEKQEPQSKEQGKQGQGQGQNQEK